MKEKSSITTPTYRLTPFEAYLMTVSGTHLSSIEEYEKLVEPPLPEIYCEVLLRFVEK